MKMHRLRVGVGVLVGLGLSLIAAHGARAGQDLDGRVDAFVGAEMREQRIPGVALAVLRDGKVVKAQGYGLANVELNVAVKPETVFQTGSVGKQFTATAVMMLVEEGKVGLDDKLSKYLAGTPASVEGRDGAEFADAHFGDRGLHGPRVYEGWGTDQSARGLYGSGVVSEVGAVAAEF